MTDALNALLEPIRQEYANNPEFQESFELAYPKPKAKVKKVKDKGSKYPGPNPNMKTAEQGADVLASLRMARGQEVEDKVKRRFRVLGRVWRMRWISCIFVLLQSSFFLHVFFIAICYQSPIM